MRKWLSRNEWENLLTLGAIIGLLIIVALIPAMTGN